MVAKLDHPCAAAAQQNAGSPPLNCPRCDSTNTKFCYYNNYSLAQPRHFCKSCKRYWTRGGTLRNVPVGGGCRKNKRPKKTHRSAPITPASLPPHPLIPISPAADLGSLLYGFPSMIDSSANFFPKFEIDDQLAPPGYEDGFTSCLQQPAADFVGDYNSMLSRSQIPSSSPPVAAEEYQQPMLQLPHDDDDRLNGTWSGSTMINWRVGKETQSFAAGQPSSSYVLWNQAMSGGWQESGSSVAPLI